MTSTTRPEPATPAPASTALAPAAAPNAAALDRTPVHMGLAPTTLDEGWRLAKMFAASDLVPKNFRNKPEDVLVAIQMGTEIGFAPMQALQSIAVINGRPGVWGDGFLALIMASPLYQDHEEFFEVDGTRRDGLTADDFKKDTTAAVCTFKRKGKPLPVTSRFTVGHARKAQLLGKEGPWQTYPDRMLKMRARGFAGRDAFPDLLRGIKTAEELRDLPPDGPVVASVERISDTRAPAPEPPSSAAPALDPVAADVVFVGTVRDVASILGDVYVTLADGVTAFVKPGAADVAELRKFAGTDHKVRLVCTPTTDGLHLKSFTVAD